MVKGWVQMILLLTIILLLISLTTNLVLIRRLFQFDGFVTTISDGLDQYNQFLIKKTSRGILQDHPEIQEFHFKTLEMIRTIDTWAKVWEKGLDSSKPSVAQLMSEDPRRN